MVRRIAARHERVTPADVEYGESAFLQKLAEMHAEIGNQSKLAETLFGADLPNTRRADEDLVSRSGDDLPRGTAQARAGRPPPKQCMGIEQDPH